MESAFLLHWHGQADTEHRNTGFSFDVCKKYLPRYVGGMAKLCQKRFSEENCMSNVLCHRDKWYCER